MSEFAVAKLGDLASVKSGFAFKSKDFGGHDYPVVKIANIKPPLVDLKSCQRISSLCLASNKRASNFELAKGDILIAMTGATAGKIGRVPETTSRVFLNQRVGKVFLQDTESACYDYIYYVLSQKHVSRSILQQSDGSAQGNISGQQIEQIELPLPSLKDQKAIAHILGILDDKIELNQKINQTLGDIAKAIFKSWFVDFDPVRAKVEGRPTGLPPEISNLFPDEFVDSEIGEIPKGWGVAPFTETFEFFSGGTPKTSVEEYWGGDVPWFSIADLNASSPWVTETEKSITELGLSRCSAKLIASGTTIVTARGTVGKVALAGQNMAINQSCYAMAPATGYPNSWLYLQTLALVERLRANAHGSVFDTITRKTFDQFLVLSAPSEVLKKFGKMTSPIFERMKTADLESKTLSELRDTLLPKLISGELRIPDAEKFLEEAGI